MVIQIENIQPKYKKEIHSLLQAINTTDNLGYSLTDEWLDYIIRYTSQSVLIAVYKGQLMGLATCMINEVDPAHAVINIIVHPNHRNQGIGTRLYDQVTTYAKTTNIKNLEAYVKERLHNSANFAKKRGFTTTMYAWEMSLEVNLPQIEPAPSHNQALKFRQANLADSQTYANIINQVFGDSLDPNILGEILKDPSVIVYILEKEGQAIGTTTIQLKPNLSTGYIYDIALTEESRGQGFGSHMIKASISELQTHNIAKATLTVTGENKKALRLYQRLGFEETDIDLLMNKILIPD